MGCRMAPFLVEQVFAYVKRGKTWAKNCILQKSRFLYSFSDKKHGQKTVLRFFFKQLQNGYNNKKR